MFEEPETADAARALQSKLAVEVLLEDRLGLVTRVAGADVAYEKEGDRFWAAVCVLDALTKEVVERVSVAGSAAFPYVPGLLSFRELPPLLACFAKLSAPVDLVICDGQGFMHPRRFGVACHLGVVLNVPTIGCGKTRLLGEHSEPGEARASFAEVRHEGERIGDVLRTQDGVKPVYVSPGHRVSFESARQWVLEMAPRYRLPETTRAADQEVGRLRREALL